MSEPTRYPYAGDGIRLIDDDTPERQLDGWLEENVLGTQFWSVYAEEFGYRSHDDWNYDKENILQGPVLEHVPSYTSDALALYRLCRVLRSWLTPEQFQELDRRVFAGAREQGVLVPSYYDSALIVQTYLRELHLARTVELPLKAVTA